MPKVAMIQREKKERRESGCQVDYWKKEEKSYCTPQVLKQLKHKVKTVASEV